MHFLPCLLALTFVVPPQDVAPNKLYPLKVGNTWHYKLDIGGQTINMVNKIAGIDKEKDVELFRLEVTVGDRPNAASEHLRASEQGVFRHKFNNQDCKPPVQLLRAPVKDGDTWKANVTIGGQDATIDAKAGKEEVTVPAGKYKTVSVKFDTETNGQKVSTTYWFAEGVGIVKQTLTLPNGTVGTMELHKFEQGK